MTTSPEQVHSMWRERQSRRAPVIEQMRLIQQTYNGDLVVPLPELDSNERSAVANIVATGADQLGMRVASVLPGVWFPSQNPGNRAADRRANTCRKATVGGWEATKMQLKLRRRARHLLAYGATPVVLRPDWRKGISRWEVRDPLGAFPAPSGDPDEMAPADVIFAFTRSAKWIADCYPEQWARLSKGPLGANGGRVDPNAAFDLLEYVDGEESVLLVVGKSDGSASWPAQSGSGMAMVELERLVNRTGLCPAVMPGRITLDRPRGQFDDVPGMMQWMARLMALELHATERGVFPDSYLVSRAGETAQFISGPHDGRTGMVNIVKGGEMREVSSAPGFATNPTIDRLERTARVTGGIPPEFGGESQGNIRTGKRGDAVISAVVDFPVQEAQELLAASLEHENRVAIAQAKAYFGSERRSFYVNSKLAKGDVTYTAADVFVSDDNRVTYAQAGSDINGLVISGGQRVGIGTLSKRSFMELDPLVSDPEAEMDQVTVEGLAAALLSSVQTQASQGAIPPNDLARIMQLVGTDRMELAEAIMQAQKEAQQRQAAMAPDPNAAPGQDAAAGVDPNSPEAQPGLAAPGMGAEAGVAVQPPGQSSQNLSALLSSLRSPQRTLPVERGAA